MLLLFSLLAAAKSSSERSARRGQLPSARADLGLGPTVGAEEEATAGPAAVLLLAFPAAALVMKKGMRYCKGYPTTRHYLCADHVSCITESGLVHGWFSPKPLMNEMAVTRGS